MGWPGERQRHAMSSRGISTKQPEVNPNKLGAHGLKSFNFWKSRIDDSVEMADTTIEDQARSEKSLIVLTKDEVYGNVLEAMENDDAVTSEELNNLKKYADEQYVKYIRGIQRMLGAHGLGGGDVYAGMRVKVNRKDLTAVYSAKKPWGGFRVFFIKKRYNDGSYLAFWSDAPWGRTRDQDKGWVVIKVPKGRQYGEVIDYVQTFDFGPTGEDYRGFLARNKEEHGGYKESYDEHRMTEGYY